MFPLPAKASSALLLAALLASCSTPGMFPNPGEAYIQDITVTASPSSVVPTDLAPRVQQKMAAEVQHFPRTGTPQHVTIVVEGYHQKDALKSLLIGDDNRMSSTLIVKSQDNGALRTAPLYVTGNGAVNGVIGAVIAASQKDEVAKDTMSGQTSSQALELFYGTKLLQSYRSAPLVAVTPSVAAPVPKITPSPAPASSKARSRRQPATS